MHAYVVTTGSYGDALTFGVIVAPNKATAQYQLDLAQLALAREARDSDSGSSDEMPVLRMYETSLLNPDMLVDHTGSDAARAATQ